MITKHRMWVAVTMTGVLLVGLLLPACKGKTWEILLEQEVSAAEGATITSADGKVTLEIPPNALEEDTMITVGIVSEDGWTEETRFFEPLGSVLALEPDGLEFSKPVGITIRFDLDDLANRSSNSGYPPLLLLSQDSNNKFDIFRNLTTRISHETGEVTVSGETSHFSWAISTIHPSLTISFSPSEGQIAFVGEQFNSTIKVANTGTVPQTVTLEYQTEGDVIVVGQSSVSLTIDKDSDEFANPQPCWRCERKGMGINFVIMKLPYTPDLADMFALAWQKKNPGQLPPEFQHLENLWDDSDPFLKCMVGAGTRCDEVTSPPRVAVDTETPETTVIESSSVFEENSPGIYKLMFDFPDNMEGKVYDFEIYPAKMTPPWAETTVPGVLRPGVYKSFIVEGSNRVGIRIFSNEPFPITPFTLTVHGDPRAEKIDIYLTDKDHKTIGVLHISKGVIPTSQTTDTDEPTGEQEEEEEEEEPSDPCPDCGNNPCTCCPDCGNDPCTCCPDCGNDPCICCPDCGNDPCTCCPDCGNDPCICCPYCGNDPCTCCPDCGNDPCICCPYCGNYPCTCY